MSFFSLKVKLVCVPSADDASKDEPLFSNHPEGTKLAFTLVKGKQKKAFASKPTAIDTVGHPGWNAFFADLVFANDEGEKALTWRNNWKLSV